MDSTDPVGPAAGLFTDECLGSAASVLKPEGMFVAQTESLHFHLDFIREVQGKLARLFKIATSTGAAATYGAPGPSLSLQGSQLGGGAGEVT
jgi:spermidine synthase